MRNRDQAHENGLLAALPRDERARMPELRAVFLAQGRVLCGPDADFEHAYFPAGSVIALVSALPGGHEIEMARVGDEGIIGSPLLKPGRSVIGSAVVARPGRAYELPCDALLRELRRDGVLHRLVFRYTKLLMERAAGAYAARLSDLCMRPGR